MLLTENSRLSIITNSFATPRYLRLLLFYRRERYAQCTVLRHSERCHAKDHKKESATRLSGWRTHSNEKSEVTNLGVVEERAMSKKTDLRHRQAYFTT